MRRIVFWPSLAALVLLAVPVALTFEVSLHGALINVNQERFPGAVRFIILAGAAGEIGALFMLIAGIAAFTSAVRRRQGIWALAIALTLPLSAYGCGALGFKDDPIGLLALLLPNTTLLYALRLPTSDPTSMPSTAP